MSKNQDVLEKSVTADQKVQSKAVRRVLAHGARNDYVELIHGVFGSGSSGMTHGAIAFTASSHGEGVSYVAQSVAAQLARISGEKTLLLEAAALRGIELEEVDHLPALCMEAGEPDLFVLTAARSSIGAAKSVLRHPQKPVTFYQVCLASLRRRFPYVVLDCPPWGMAPDAVLAVPCCDGVILVVEAGRARAGDVARARDALEAAGSRLLGCVLNKRTYPVPSWLYRYL